ncbi:MAG TPA: hypothetical protein VFB38_25880 [Chthonomonadaceae bacterium]|nr:hypothetical protein [Chthonomonadaceae bacterium]
MLPQGAQDVLLVNLPGIMNALRPTLARSMGKPSGSSSVSVDDIVQMFGPTNGGIAGTQKCDGQEMTLTFFLPIDYDRLIHVIGQMTGQSANGPSRGGSPNAMPTAGGGNLP